MPKYSEYVLLAYGSFGVIFGYYLFWMWRQQKKASRLLERLRKLPPL